MLDVCGSLESTLEEKNISIINFLSDGRCVAIKLHNLLYKNVLIFEHKNDVDALVMFNKLPSILIQIFCQILCAKFIFCAVHPSDTFYVVFYTKSMYLKLLISIC